MTDHLEPHPLSTLFPPLSDQALQALADDIRQNGQREPVLTYEGKVLDGWNRVRACRRIGRKPWLMEFDPASAKMTPEQLVISANLRRRHLSVGQMSAIVVELSEQIEPEGGNTRDAFNGEFGLNRTGQAGRPKSALTAEPWDDKEKLPVFEIRVDAYAAITGRSPRQGSLYEQLKKAVRGLQHAEVALPGGERIAFWLRTRGLAQQRYVKSHRNVF
jgi:hypothetical protein